MFSFYLLASKILAVLSRARVTNNFSHTQNHTVVVELCLHPLSAFHPPRLFSSTLTTATKNSVHYDCPIQTEYLGATVCGNVCVCVYVYMCTY